MKKLSALFLALMMLALPALSMAEASVTAAEDATLTVTGSASVSLKADYARVSVGVSTKAATVVEATEHNGTAIRAVIAALIEAGVAEEDIATSSYSVHAEYDYMTGEAVLAGYNVTNQLTVILRDMTCIGATLDKATEAGANNIYNVEFLSDASADAQDEAMGYAVAEAIRKAQVLAKASGLTLGGVKSISESTSGWYGSAKQYTSADRVASSNVILPDDLSVSASVTIVFELN